MVAKPELDIAMPVPSVNTDSGESYCWQCTEICIRFTEVMHVVYELNLLNDHADADNIIKELWTINSGYTKTILARILRYACKAGYLTPRASDGVTTYSVSVTPGCRRCVGCGEKMGLFNPEEYTGVSSVRTKFIQRSTFVALVSNLNVFKKFVTEAVINAG